MRGGLRREAAPRLDGRRHDRPLAIASATAIAVRLVRTTGRPTCPRPARSVTGSAPRLDVFCTPRTVYLRTTERARRAAGAAARLEGHEGRRGRCHRERWNEPARVA